jgi:hypothetical protein
MNKVKRSDYGHIHLYIRKKCDSGISETPTLPPYQNQTN